MERAFYEIVGRVEERVVKETGSDRGRGDEEEEISSEEVRRDIGMLKNGKAAGMNKISNEVWRYGGEGGKVEGLGNFATVSRKERDNRRGRKGVIVPILKKGHGANVEDYRGVTLMSTIYKMYMCWRRD